MFDTHLGIAYAAVAGSFICAVADNWNYNASYPCLHCGGNYNQNQNHGLFYVNYNSTSNTNANIGCRILVIAGPHQGFRASAWLASFLVERVPHPFYKGYSAYFRTAPLARAIACPLAKINR